eukprot:CAMPEP_0185587966 /NCGR_PEP_ID=MMETSP0434-20130131/51377_1 /TAXON_ID=626734 ORGANISM="Favella taraikaensis, Strain Fe Narragansett Bay" /NCGR_SAMPLE_ID=MMETSP0434 /ASSEMBLY_ACC=CAM_ASM_000379 /LENGTH=140 /DNA_ID=CAMNT_0028210297 /DNA_START=237 /DNA_END=659 /DNA_ORIENTATION=-
MTGISNFCSFFLAKQLANFINLFVGVNSDDLSELWVLYLITTFFCLMPLLFLWLVPKRKEVFLVQQINEFVEKYPPKRYDFDESVDDDDDVSSTESESRKNFIDGLMKLNPKVAREMGVYKLYADELGDSFEHPANDSLP